MIAHRDELLPERPTAEKNFSLTPKTMFKTNLASRDLDTEGLGKVSGLALRKQSD
jgi:hypothetical protein